MACNNSKQIITGLEGSRQIYLPLEIQDPPREFLMTEAQTEISGEAILNLKGQIDSLLIEGPIIICFILPLC